MQVRPGVVGRVAVDVMHYFPALGSSNGPMFPFSPPDAAAALPLGIKGAAVRPVGLRDGRGRSRRGKLHFSAWCDSDVAASQLAPDWHCSAFLIVGKQRVAVPVPHLVVAHTHFTRSHWAKAELTGTADNATSPFVISGPMFSNAFVVHQAEAVGRVAALAPVDRANSHVSDYTTCYNALGNSVDELA